MSTLDPRRVRWAVAADSLNITLSAKSRRLDLIVVARAGDEDAERNVLEEGDVIVGVGAPHEIRALEALFAPREPVAG